MKKLFIALVIVLFTISASAQQKKPAAKAENCCPKHTTCVKMTPEEIAKCQATCKAEGKKCTAQEMAKCKKEAKSCCAKK
jgi:hypothetical protein